MRNKKYVTHGFKGLVNLMPPPQTKKILRIDVHISIDMLILKIAESWKIQFTNTLFIALL